MIKNIELQAQLVTLPYRKWDDISKYYDSLLIYSTGTKHDSGYGNITIIGCHSQTPSEIITTSADDINWKKIEGQMRTDCILPSRALHFWTNNGKLKYWVGVDISSIDIHLNK